MKVRVKEGKVGFIYGILRREGQEFELENSEQFSKVWMESLEEAKEPEQKKPESGVSTMKVKELKAALDDKGIEIPEEALKPDLIKLLEESE